MSGPVSFPSNYPQNCPPQNAVDADIVVYRTVANDPPLAGDFQSYVEAGKVKKRPKCNDHSVSVMRSKEDAVHHREVFGGNIGGKFIAVGTLLPAHGKTEGSSYGNFPSHTDWWPYENVQRHTVFTVVQGL
jgi:hypothetical protein